MSCGSGPATFRLLDAYVGWEEQEVRQLEGLTDPNGIRLADACGTPRPLRRHDLLPWFPPRRLARGCGPCSWYLASRGRGLLRREPCPPGFQPVWPPGCDPELVDRPRLVAARGHVVAVADTGRVLVWRRDGENLIGVIPTRAQALALTPWGELLVARAGSTDLERFDLTGASRGTILTGATGRVKALTTGHGWSIWALTQDGGTVLLWRGQRGGGRFERQPLDRLAAEVDRTTLTTASKRGFCLTEPGPDGDPTANCFTWNGDRLTVDPPAPPELATGGRLLTRAIDSGLPRCRWHRVRVEAEVPPGTTVRVAVATSEDGALAAPEDWQEDPAGTGDFLVDQPPGRYLYLRLRLARDRGADSPTVRRIRLDFPRVTSADLLPAVFRNDPAADDFTERFLSLFDASLEDLDRAIERHPALLAGRDVPDEVLPWLAGLLGLAFEPGWDAATRRALLATAPELYRRRGTPWALEQAIRIVFKVDPVIHELAPDRDWAALGRASRLRSAHLFGRSKARLRLGSSALSTAPLRSFGNPDDDPLTAHANRFRVLLPPARGPAGELDQAAVARLVQRQAPAHTMAEVRLGGLGFVVGTWSAVGVDSAFVPLPAPVLGRDAPGRRGRAVRLGRHSVVWPGRGGRRHGVRVGVGSVVGIGTAAE